MSKFHLVKSLSYWLSMTRNSMGYKFRKPFQKQVRVNVRWELEPFIQFSTASKRKNSLSLAGEMKLEKNEEVQDGATTSSQEVELPLWNPSNPSEPISFLGNPSEKGQTTNLPHDTFIYLVRREAELIHSTPDLDSTDLIEILETQSKLEKRLRKYKKADPAETWASRWVASSIAYLLPEERREEWLGDLYEVNREMLHKEYPRLLVNFINVGRTAVLMVSALKVKLSDFLSLGVRKAE